MGIIRKTEAVGLVLKEFNKEVHAIAAVELINNATKATPNVFLCGRAKRIALQNFKNRRNNIEQM